MGQETHGSLAAEAAAYLADGAEAVGEFNGIQSQIRRQARCLVEWARRKGVILDNSYTAGMEKYGCGTSEHEVYFDRAEKRVVKCTKPGKFGFGHGPKGKYARHPDATPYFYLRRLELMNQEFDTDLRLEGIALAEPDSGNTGETSVSLITSQRFIESADKNNPHPSEAEIAAYMTKLRFKLIEESWYNWIREADGVVVTDAKQLNFINSPEGIVPIDLIVSKPQTLEET